MRTFYAVALIATTALGVASSTRPGAAAVIYPGAQTMAGAVTAPRIVGS
jgi:hypothetical protein